MGVMGMAITTAGVHLEATFSRMSARRLLIFGGIGLILGGMLFGDIFAVFGLHQNAGHTSAVLLAAAQAVGHQNPAAVRGAFAEIGDLLEDHGTKVDTHAHMIDVGYLALLLALIQPYVAWSAKVKKRLAKCFLLAAVLLPIGIFLIHYVRLSYSPFTFIGWASILADMAGALLILALLGEAWGLGIFLRGRSTVPLEAELAEDNAAWEERALLAGGTLLVLLGFTYGAWYAARNLSEQEKRETAILRNMLDQGREPAESAVPVGAYGQLQAEKAVEIAAHAHLIEFGILAMLLSLVQPYVFLTPRWKRRWVRLLLLGSLLLPVFVLLELKLGLVAGGIADAGGLMVVIALIAMLVGVLRSTGALDAQAGSPA